VRVSSVGLVCVSVCASFAACAKSSGGGFDDGSSGTLFTPTDSGVKPLAECADNTKDVYVITDGAKLYRFHPPTLEFTPVGQVACTTSGTPTSMAVDREGVAWIRHSDGTLWKLSTQDLSCTATTFTAPTNDFIRFGMGFASNSAGSSAETLYLSDHAGKGLGKLDLQTLAIGFVGAWGQGLDGTTAELTGTGDGKLYGFFVTEPATLAEISQTTGAVLTAKPLTGVSAGTAWAFSFYGGDFFIYTAAAAESDVTRYRPSDGTITVVKPSIGFRIVGAGVSTCAPTTTPH
jgi:hypothetical protein